MSNGDLLLRDRIERLEAIVEMLAMRLAEVETKNRKQRLAVDKFFGQFVAPESEEGGPIEWKGARPPGGIPDALPEEMGGQG